MPLGPSCDRGASTAECRRQVRPVVKALAVTGRVARLPYAAVAVIGGAPAYLRIIEDR